MAAHTKCDPTSLLPVPNCPKTVGRKETKQENHRRLQWAHTRPHQTTPHQHWRWPAAAHGTARRENPKRDESRGSRVATPGKPRGSREGGSRVAIQGGNQVGLRAATPGQKITTNRMHECFLTQHFCRSNNKRVPTSKKTASNGIKAKFRRPL